MRSITRSVALTLIVAAAVAVTIRGLPQTDSRPESKTAALFRESYALEAKQDFAGALARMRDAQKAGVTSYFITLRMAWLAYLAGDFKSSATGYAEAAALEPKAVEPKLGLTLPLLAQRNWRELERACRDVLTLDPRNAIALSRLGQAYYWAGNYPDSVATYRRLSADYPSDLDHQTGLAWALLKMGRTAEARQLFEAVLAVSPDNINAKQGLAAK